MKFFLKHIWIIPAILIIIGEYFVFRFYLKGNCPELEISIFLFLALAITYRFRNSLRGRQVLFILSALSAVRYLIWRIAETFGAPGLVNQITTGLFFATESYIILVNLLIWFLFSKYNQDLKPEIKDKPDEYNPSVDVFITTLNEPKEVVRRTIICAQSIDYKNKRVFLLDDGNRDFMKELASKLDCEYIARQNPEFAKAGNLNNALLQTSGEFVLILDADHLAANTIINQCLGYTVDSQVALVQASFSFMNPSPIIVNLKLNNKIPDEMEWATRMFLPALDTHHSSHWFGSGALLRRSALDTIGGIKQVVGEDLRTSLDLLGKNFKTIYHPIPQSYMLSPENMEAYLTQQCRWSNHIYGGTISLDNPIIKAGLSFEQRLAFLTIFVCYYVPLARVMYVFCPAAYLIFNVAPLWVTNINELQIVLLPFVAGILLSGSSINESRSQWAMNEIYESFKAPHNIVQMLKTFFAPSKKLFETTPKGLEETKERINFKLVIPHIVAVIILLIAYPMAIARLNQGHSLTGVFICYFWNTLQLFFLLGAIAAVCEKPVRFKDIQTEIDLDVEFKSEESASVKAKIIEANEFGALIKLATKSKASAGESCLVTIETSGRCLEIKGTIEKISNLDKVQLAFSLDDENINDIRTLTNLFFSENKDWQTLKPWKRSESMISALKLIYRNVFATLAGIVKGRSN